MKLTLPFPNMAKLNAHAKGNAHWGKSKATSAARSQALYICVDLMNRKQVHPIAGQVLISYAIYVPNDRPRDTCNILQALKPTIDGIVDSGLVEGDSWQQMKLYNVSVEIDKKNPRVEITINSTSGMGDLLSKG